MSAQCDSTSKRYTCNSTKSARNNLNELKQRNMAEINELTQILEAIKAWGGGMESVVFTYFNIIHLKRRKKEEERKKKRKKGRPPPHTHIMYKRTHIHTHIYTHIHTREDC